MNNKTGEMQTVSVLHSPFFKQVLDVIDTYQEQFGVKPSVVRMREPYYDGVQAEFEIMTGKRSGLATVQGVAIEKVSLIYKNDLEVL